MCSPAGPSVHEVDELGVVGLDLAHARRRRSSPATGPGDSTRFTSVRPVAAARWRRRPPSASAYSGAARPTRPSRVTASPVAAQRAEVESPVTGSGPTAGSLATSSGSAAAATTGRRRAATAARPRSPRRRPRRCGGSAAGRRGRRRTSPASTGCRTRPTRRWSGSRATGQVTSRSSTASATLSSSRSNSNSGLCTPTMTSRRRA